MYKSGEIYSVMTEFEKVANGRFDKEKDKDLWKKGQWYESGEVNNLFTMYLHGYTAGKCAERMGFYI